MDIKPIETIYNGYRFRSRLEARWAVFFDTLGITWEYEKEGYDLDGVWYLPDFYLPEYDVWVEIKGKEPTEEELMRCARLSYVVDRPVYLFYGSIPLPPQEPITAIEYWESPQSGATLDTISHSSGRSVIWLECPLCHQFDFSVDGAISPRSHLERCDCFEKFTSIWYELRDLRKPHPTVDKRDYEWLCDKFGQFMRSDDTPRLIDAYTAARRARFEFGESVR